MAATAAPELALAQSGGELAKAAQNPIASLISVPFQNNTYFGFGPDNQTQNVLNIQPVVPFSIGASWNIVTRTIIPLAYTPWPQSAFGLGDVQPQIYIVPPAFGHWTIGLGPLASLPTATSSVLGTGKWSAGITGVVVYTEGPWVAGVLANNLWSFAGKSDRERVSGFLMQPFVNYNLEEGWYLVSSPIITANWKAESNERWTVPLGGGFGKIFRIGHQPLNATLQGYYNVVSPRIGPDWSVRAQLQFLFPKGS